jgi:hypothetical protein
MIGQDTGKSTMALPAIKAMSGARIADSKAVSTLPPCVFVLFIV